MSDASNPSRRTLIIAGGAVVAAGAGAYAISRGAIPGLGSADNSAFEPVSYSFEDSQLCRLTASMTEGPYYVEEALIRSDIREDRAGKQTTLRLKVVEGTTCAALPGAAVDIWHCDGEGNYSAAPAMGSEARTAQGHLQPASAARFLRGRQIADANGFVEFVTIYPGWYPGRTPHIHLKVLIGTREAATTQLFFPKELSNEVYAGGIYSKRGLPSTTNDNDHVLSRAKGADGAWPKVTRAGDGLMGTLTIGVTRAA